MTGLYPPWHPVEVAAKELFAKAATGKPWTGRRTNRAYYRRRARDAIAKATALEQSIAAINGEKGI